MDKTVIFDLYTKRSYDEVGGKKGINKMGISIAGIYDYSTNELKLYEEENVDELIKELLSSSLVVGINLKKFNYKVLMAFSRNDFSNLNSLDILEHFKKKLSFKPAIEDLLNGTLGIDKIRKNENYVPRLFKQGKIDEIKALCKENILELKKFYDFGKEKGYTYFSDNHGQRWKISVDW